MIAFAGYPIYQLTWYFLIYSFLGWCVEVVFCTVTSGKVVNRGFLNGPVCPIYGFGMLAVLLLLKRLGGGVEHASIFLLFFGGMVLASAVELVGGWLMLKLFHARWWDYSDKPFNIGGFVCLEFSLIWGIGAVGVVRLLHPIIAAATFHWVVPSWGLPVLGVFYAVYLIDLIVTLFTVAGLNHDLQELDRVRASLRTVSDSLSNRLGTGALETDRRLDEGRLQATLATAQARDAFAEARLRAADSLSDARSAAAGVAQQASAAMAEAKQNVQAAVSEAHQQAAGATASSLQTLLETRTSLEKRAAQLRDDVLNKAHFGGGRLLKAFPDMVHVEYKDLLNDLKRSMASKKK